MLMMNNVIVSTVGKITIEGKNVTFENTGGLEFNRLTRDDVEGLAELFTQAVDKLDEGHSFRPSYFRLSQAFLRNARNKMENDNDNDS